MANLLRNYDPGPDPGRWHGAVIGVLARAEDRPVVREFFELFKAPWEFYRADGQYEVLLQTDGIASPHPASLVIVYGSQATAFDEVRRRRPGAARSNVTVASAIGRFPVAGRCVAIPPDGGVPDVVFEDTQDPVALVIRAGAKTVVRVGYDLFAEVRRLLTAGQPAAHAAIPTLERHIALLRRWILGAGIPLVELPPVPEGSPFIVCLTHDVDHPSIRLHRFDHTMFGFLHRAVLGSALNACRGRTSLTALRRNVVAALTLPFVHLGWANDFWSDFDRYLELEKGLGSTFFFIPTKGSPGRTRDGAAPRLRAASYGVSDVADRARMLAEAGCEVGVHGIDAWIDSASGTRERRDVTCITGTPTKGVRMHWLYSDEHTPTRLDEAGFGYDSSFGYNETVGFRAGTLQAFKPITAHQLLELPLHVMDTALFYPSYLHLTADTAKPVVARLIDEAERHGGALTINWHDRSLAPERLWDGYYIDLLDDLKRRAAWFPTASQAVSWFRRRRSARFEVVQRDGSAIRVAVSADATLEGPGLTLRVHQPSPTNDHWPPPSEGRTMFTDVPFKDSLNARVERSV